ncbi:MAG TPA: NAD(P)/FAD-dependent oxidoreductase [Ignavibacteriaceae bacterium]|nr:NAD(P)/FAD-dependent oxidoreductase [Ignavibacteriaceae bacterium]
MKKNLHSDSNVVIIGAGPAGLTAAYELIKQGIKPVVVDKDNKVGGLARTEKYKGYRFDIGGHRFYTKVGEVEDLWNEVLGENFRKVPRLSRIYYKKRFYNYPLNIFNTLLNLGIIESFLILLSFAKWKITPYKFEKSFEHWVTNRFGKRLYKIFFKSYTEKVWGTPCSEIRADWAAQRIKDLSLKSAVMNSIFHTNGIKSLINEFNYPVYGPGMMWEGFQEKVEKEGGSVKLNSDVVAINHENNKIKSIVITHDEIDSEIKGDQFISSMPISELIFKLNPKPPKVVIDAANELSYRAMILVGLIINKKELFPDNWLYIHSPEFIVGRIQNFKNWSFEMAADVSKTNIGMEYFCTEGDKIWSLSDDELIKLAKQELIGLKIISGVVVEDAVVFRQPKAYPVYDSTYMQNLEILKKYLSRFENFQTVGRNGMHRYNNQDHSMLTSILAVKNLFGEQNDLWNVNTERSYYEEVSLSENKINVVKPVFEAT